MEQAIQISLVDQTKKLSNIDIDSSSTLDQIIKTIELKCLPSKVRDIKLITDLQGNEEIQTQQDLKNLVQQCRELSLQQIQMCYQYNLEAEKKEQPFNIRILIQMRGETNFYDITPTSDFNNLKEQINS